MELNKLYYFYVVAQHQHVTRAAEELHIAQPALTKTIKLLERELGIPLFYKRGRNIFLTEFGCHLKNRLDSVFSILGALPDELESMKQQARSTVKLNVLAASTIVTAAVVSYKKKNEHTIFQLIQNEEDFDCDISITTNTVNFSKLPAFEKRCIMEEKIYLAVPRDSEYAKYSSIDLKELKNKEFVNLTGSRMFRTVCDEFCAAAGFKPKIVFESDSPTAVKNIIGAGAGVGFWPAFSWGNISLSDVVLLPIHSPVCNRELIIGLHSQKPASPAAEDFYNYLLRYVKKHVR